MKPKAVSQKFVVRPDKDCYFAVYIFRDRETMRKAGKSLSKFLGKKDGRNYEARFNGFSPPPYIGNILFYEQHCGTKTVTHEMSHATFHWMRINKISVPTNSHGSRTEETYAKTIGELARQFWVKYYRKNRNAGDKK